MIEVLRQIGVATIMIGLVPPGETALLVAGYFVHEGVLSLPVMWVERAVGERRRCWQERAEFDTGVAVEAAAANDPVEDRA